MTPQAIKAFAVREITYTHFYMASNTLSNRFITFFAQHITKPTNSEAITHRHQYELLKQ